MENAGRACFDKINEITGISTGKSFVILCVKGNNGGDGIVLAHHLTHSKAKVICVFVHDLPTSECAEESYKKYVNHLDVILYNQNESIVQKALTCCDVIVDCVFGTGLHGTLEPKSLFNFINNKCHALKISVNLPSGINSDTGEIAEYMFTPDITLILGAVKKGLLCNSDC